MMLKFLPPNGSVLDIGCGTCAQTLALLKRGYHITAIDSSDRMVENAKQILKKSGFPPEIIHLKSLFDLSENEKFDVIMCLDVIEHIEDDFEAFRILCNSLKKDGILLISVPAVKFLYSKRDEELGHYRRYDQDRLTSLFNSCDDIVLERIRPWNFTGIIPVFLNKLRDKRVNEEFRYSEKNVSKLINKSLHLWFKYIENNINIGIGLTLFCIGRKR